MFRTLIYFAKESKTLPAFIFVLTITALSMLGWGLNISKLMQMDAFNGMMAARIIGIPLVPLGAVLGAF